MRDLNVVIAGIEGFIKYWRHWSEHDVTNAYRERFAPIVDYWVTVLASLRDSPRETEATLREPFWPQTRLDSALYDVYEANGELREELVSDVHYVGPRDNRPHPTMRPGVDCLVGSFVLIRPGEGYREELPVWFGRATAKPNLLSTGVHPREVGIQWYIPSNTSRAGAARYIGWDTNLTFSWKPDTEHTRIDWIPLDTLLASWSRRSGSSLDKVTIPARQILYAKDNLTRCVEESNFEAATHL